MIKKINNTAALVEQARRFFASIVAAHRSITGGIYIKNIDKGIITKGKIFHI